MASTSSVSPPRKTDRRSSARRRLEGLAYVDLGPDNGAILIDLGEDGLGFQSVAPVTLDQAVLLKFRVPGRSEYIETFADVVWLNDSGKGGGLRFSELPAEARDQIRVWMGVSSPSEPAAAAEVSAAAPQNKPAAAVTNAAQPRNIPAADRASTDVAGKEAAPAEEIPEPVAESAEDTKSTAEIGESAEVEEAEHFEVADSPDESAQEIAKEISSPAAVQEARKPEPPAAGATPVPVAPEVKPAKVRPAGRVPADSIPTRVHSGILAASAESVSGDAVEDSGSEPSAPAPSAAPRRAPATGANPPVHAATLRTAQTPPRAARPESDVANPYRGNAPVSASLRRTPRAEPLDTPETAVEPDEGRISASTVLSSQLLKVGVAAIAGATVVLAIVALVPSLRTRVQATNAKSNAPGLSAPVPEFQVEVADLNNRRWILKSGGEAGSPFSDAPSRRESAAAARNAADKSSRSSDNADSGTADTSDTPAARRRTAQRGELPLARPLAGRPAAPQVQAMAPSIFDGITPPIGSLNDTLPVSGPAMPGPVVQQQQGPRPAVLQSAVLLQRVPPVYPATAIAMRVTGQVQVVATIGKDGIPTNLKVLSGDARLVNAALAAVRQWRYRPATLDGDPIETTTTVSVAFELR